MNNPILLIPMAGKGSRFVNAGYPEPKQLLPDGNNGTLIQKTLSKLLSNRWHKVIFIVSFEQNRKYNFTNLLPYLFKNNYQDIEVLVLERETIGPAHTIHEFAEYLKQFKDHPVYIHTLDVETPNLDILPEEDGCSSVYTFQANSPNYSYSKKINNKLVFAEKKVISNNASAGIYKFADMDLLLEAIHYCPEKNHIAPLYNQINTTNMKIFNVDNIYIFGTPEEYEFYLTIPKYDTIRSAICSDHSGFESKEMIKKLMPRTFDIGCYSMEACNYGDFVIPVCDKIRSGQITFGIGFCRSGQGVNICANAQKGIRSALIYDLETLETAITHNAANFFSFPSRIFNNEEILSQAIHIINNNQFEGGRHQNRLMQCESYT